MFVHGSLFIPLQQHLVQSVKLRLLSHMLRLESSPAGFSTFVYFLPDLVLANSHPADSSLSCDCYQPERLKKVVEQQVYPSRYMNRISVWWGKRNLPSPAWLRARNWLVSPWLTKFAIPLVQTPQLMLSWTPGHERLWRCRSPDDAQNAYLDSGS